MSAIEALVELSRKELPELERLRLVIGGRPIPIGAYERVNALLISRNLLNGSNEDFALFHPRNDDLSVFIACVIGLQTYKDAISRGRAISIDDFVPNEKVEYKGKIVTFEGVVTEAASPGPIVRVVYGDGRDKLTEIVPLQEFLRKASKYAGDIKKAQKWDGPKSSKDYKSTLGYLLGLKPEEIKSAKYPACAFITEKAPLISKLKVTTVNGFNFFDLFPAANYSGTVKQRIAVDKKKRAYVFCLASSLSAVDDLLRNDTTIKTIVVDSGSKIRNSANLLASIRNDHDVEDIYMFQNYDGLDFIDDLRKTLPCKSWIWNADDFSQIGVEGVATRMQRIKIDLEKVDYPEGFNGIQDYEALRKPLEKLRFWNNGVHIGEIDDFLRSAYILLIRIFDSPVPLDVLDIQYQLEGKRSCSEDLDFLRQAIEELRISTLPEELSKELGSWFKTVGQCAELFSHHKKKSQRLVELILQNKSDRIGIVVRNSHFVASLNKFLEGAIAGKSSRLEVITASACGDAPHNLLIWTYRPELKPEFFLDPPTPRNVGLLYEHQLKRFRTFEKTILGRVARYSSAKERAAALGVDEAIFMAKSVVATAMQPVVEGNVEAGTTVEDEDDILATIPIHAFSGEAQKGFVEAVEARKIVFADGSVAYFRPGGRVRVLDAERQAVDSVPVSGLNIGDKTVFFKESKRTLFEELASYFEHKPALIAQIELSELWRDALIDYAKQKTDDVADLQNDLEASGLRRGVQTIENWLNGEVICPPEDNYHAIDVIAALTKHAKLLEETEKIKDACRTIHSLRKKIGRYIAAKLLQSEKASRVTVDDEVLRKKLDEISAHTEVAEVADIEAALVKIDVSSLNKLIRNEGIEI